MCTVLFFKIRTKMNFRFYIQCCYHPSRHLSDSMLNVSDLVSPRLLRGFLVCFAMGVAGDSSNESSATLCAPRVDFRDRFCGFFTGVGYQNIKSYTPGRSTTRRAYRIALGGFRGVLVADKSNAPSPLSGCGGWILGAIFLFRSV